jgi:hypothetical protein
MPVSLDSVNLRANPRYQLVPLDRLTPEDYSYLHGLESKPDVFGVLRPVDGCALPLLSVCRETALLFLILRDPGLLPTYVKVDSRAGWHKSVAQLVLDGVIELDAGGGFVSGSQAYHLVCGEPTERAITGRVARLSMDAMRYGQALDLPDASRLSARLYFYNRIPASASWHRRFPTTQSVVEYLGTEREPIRSLLEQKSLRMLRATGSGDGWIAWKSQAVKAPPSGSPLYKLYLSPDPLVVGDALQVAVDVLSRLPMVILKVGNDVYGLLRPDKILVYFKSRSDVLAAAQSLQDALNGVPAQGVPFTAAIDPDGLVSWGIDPPRSEVGLPWQERESWRLWLTNRLAAALLAGRTSEPHGLEPWRFALERLRLMGVNPDSWTPGSSLWLEPITGGRS